MLERLDMGVIMTYPSDLNDKQWNLIKHHFDNGKYGTVRKHVRCSLAYKLSNKFFCSKICIVAKFAYIISLVWI